MLNDYPALISLPALIQPGISGDGIKSMRDPVHSLIGIFVAEQMNIFADPVHQIR